MLPIILGAALVGAVVGAFASGSNSRHNNNDKLRREWDEHKRKNEEQMRKHKRMIYGGVSLGILSAPIEGIASAIGQKMGFEMWDAFGLSQFFQNALGSFL